MKTVGIIGTGRVGSTLAQLAVAAGSSVVISNSRGPETLAGLITELGPNARAATPAESAAAGDLVVVSVPVRAYRDVPVAPLSGKTVIDTVNYDPELHGRIAELDDPTGPATTSEILQQHLPLSHVVKACNNIFFLTLGSLSRPTAAADRTALPIAGDDADAKGEAAAFLDALGYDSVDVGPLTEGWRYQPGTPAHRVYVGDSIHDAVPAGTDTVRTALAAAVRPSSMLGISAEERH